MGRRVVLVDDPLHRIVAARPGKEPGDLRIELAGVALKIVLVEIQAAQFSKTADGVGVLQRFQHEEPHLLGGGYFPGGIGGVRPVHGLHENVADLFRAILEWAAAERDFPAAVGHYPRLGRARSVGAAGIGVRRGAGRGLGPLGQGHGDGGLRRPGDRDGWLRQWSGLGRQGGNGTQGNRVADHGGFQDSRLRLARVHGKGRGQQVVGQADRIHAAHLLLIAH